MKHLLLTILLTGFGAAALAQTPTNPSPEPMRDFPENEPLTLRRCLDAMRAGFRDGTGDYRDETYELEPSEEGLTYVLEDWGCGYRNADGVWVFCWPWLLLGDVE